MTKHLDIQGRNKQFFDVILEVSPINDQARLKAHRIIFCSTLLTVTQKKRKEKYSHSIKWAKLWWNKCWNIYTQDMLISMNRMHLTCWLWPTILLFQVWKLCAVMLQYQHFLSNSFAAYHSAENYPCKELQEKAWGFILANFVAVAETEGFLHLSSSTQVQEWISSHEIIVK